MSEMKKERASSHSKKTRPETTSTQKTSLPYIIILFASVAILATGAYIVWNAYDLSREGSEPELLEETPEDSGQETQPEYSIMADRSAIRAEIDAKTTDWNVYTNEAEGITFKYPGGWTVEEQTVEDDEDPIPSLQISSQTVSMKILFPPNISPSTCWYGNQTEESDGVFFLSFTEIAGYSTDLRRGIKEGSSLQQICSLDIVSKTYTNWLPGAMWISVTGETADPEELTTLDVILATYVSLP